MPASRPTRWSRTRGDWRSNRNWPTTIPTAPNSGAGWRTIHNNIGWLEAHSGKPAEAMHSYRRALAIRQKLADDNPAVTDFQEGLVISLGNIGSVLSDLGRSAEALDSYGRALAIEQKLVDNNPAVTGFQTSLAGLHRMIGNVQSSTGKLADALESYRRTLAIDQKLAGDDPRDTNFTSSLARRPLHHRNSASADGQTGRGARVVPAGAGDPAGTGRRRSPGPP